jgi:hypothetical protein
MTTEGGGWTLVLTSSDDGRGTWSMENSTLLTLDEREIGDLEHPERDFKSRALHDIAFFDLYFRHAPSDVTAIYGDVGDGTIDFGNFLWDVPYPNCTTAGYPLTGGTLSMGGRLCSTDLYLNAGDFDEGAAACEALSSTYNSSARGPVWSASTNDGCPLDDPSIHGIGPENHLCTDCEDTAYRRENGGRGFGNALDLNTGAPDASETYIQMWIR